MSSNLHFTRLRTVEFGVQPNGKKKLCFWRFFVKSAFSRQFRIGINCRYIFEDDILQSKPLPQYFNGKYIVIEDSCEDDARGESKPIFWGMLRIEDYEHITTPYSKLDGKTLMDWIKSKNAEYIKEAFPTFITAENAIYLQTDKLTALEKMEKLKTEVLPVIDNNKHLIGTVERSRLTASFLIDIGKSLNIKEQL